MIKHLRVEYKYITDHYSCTRVWRARQARQATVRVLVPYLRAYQRLRASPMACAITMSSFQSQSVSSSSTSSLSSSCSGMQTRLTRFLSASRRARRKTLSLYLRGFRNLTGGTWASHSLSHSFV